MPSGIALTVSLDSASFRAMPNPTRFRRSPVRRSARSCDRLREGAVLEKARTTGPQGPPHSRQAFSHPEVSVTSPLADSPCNRARATAHPVFRASMAAVSSGVSARPKTSRFSAMRTAWTGLGTADRPCSTCQRRITWADALPYLAAISVTTGWGARLSPSRSCSRIRPRDPPAAAALIATASPLAGVGQSMDGFADQASADDLVVGEQVGRARPASADPPRACRCTRKAVSSCANSQVRIRPLAP